MSDDRIPPDELADLDDLVPRRLPPDALADLDDLIPRRLPPDVLPWPEVIEELLDPPTDS